MTKIIEIVIEVETVQPQYAVLPEEQFGPTQIEIVPLFLSDGTIDFRVKFEPDNQARRRQPLRRTVLPIFPEA